MNQSTDHDASISRLAADGTGIVIAGHGRRNPAGAAQFELFMESFVAAARPLPVSYGFLEFASPTIDVAVSQCIAAGAKRVAVVL